MHKSLLRGGPVSSHLGRTKPATVGLVPGQRDHRLDFFRGLALVMIFINHVPGTVYEYATNRNFGFSDAAEAFVFMSGLAAGLAYSSAFAPGNNLWLAVSRPWARARYLYFVHLSITVICLAIVAFAARYFDLAELLTKNNIKALFADPLSTMIGIPLLTHQLGYLNILPLYAVLLVSTPAIILLGRKFPYWVLAGSILLWVIAGQFRLNLPNFPNSGGWFFNPFSWQLLFVIGVLSGMAMKQGKQFIPAHPVAFVLALAYLIATIVVMKYPPAGEAFRAGLSAISKMGAPFYITWFDKTFLSLPRLLHALAVFYVFASIPQMRVIASSRLAAPLRIMGRQGLAVFATGTVLSIALQAVKAWLSKEGITDTVLIDGLMLGSGIFALWLLAYVLTRTVDMRRAQSQTKTP
ncbi:OpgC domain-containing protein [Devosia sp. WQ 349]|uniref:OpgC family protein n=1 Tax=Devosia sp. WQ 349K1 TaxID=2800329 RepID=UPI001908C4F8|nr:OpgC domain-containing protein [Devosia sp. WQ 349K1]MBK1796052.1 OpgC domain-containing protein [Devosia sp. WQ 349K1]